MSLAAGRPSSRSVLWGAVGLPLGAGFAYVVLGLGLWTSEEGLTPGYLGLPTLLVLAGAVALWRWASRPLAATFCLAGIATLAFFVWLFGTLPGPDF